MARGLNGMCPLGETSLPVPIIVTTSARIISAVMPSWLSACTATPVGALYRPSSTCSVPMRPCLSERASFWAATTTARASSVNLSNMLTMLGADEKPCQYSVNDRVTV